MAKTAIVLFIIFLAVSALSAGYLSLNSEVIHAQEPDLTENSADNITPSNNTIIMMLEEAAENIQDDELAYFYQELLQEYELLEQPAATVDDEPINSTAVLPDIFKINRTAITLPLQEAGRNIQDKEIADFYYRFLMGAGWAIEPD